MRLEDFAGKHNKETGWVFGSGPSLDFLEPSFFDGKLCFSTNATGYVFGLADFYVFSHYHDEALKMSEVAKTVFTPEKEHGTDGEWAHGQIRNVVLFPTQTGRPGNKFDPFGKDNPGNSLVIGSSGIHGTMHLAAYTGCKNIVLVGADCGAIDGVDRFEGYPAGQTPWALYNEHLGFMKKWLNHRYGCRVYSLNPFVNLNLEGHRFQGVS